MCGARALELRAHQVYIKREALPTTGQRRTQIHPPPSTTRMSNDKGSSPSQLVYTCSNKSISNTTITSPDGRTSYIIETPVKWFKAKPTTLYIVNRDKEGESTAPQEVATINWKCFKPDLVTFAGQEPIRVKEVFPRRWYTWWVVLYF